MTESGLEIYDDRSEASESMSEESYVGKKFKKGKKVVPDCEMDEPVVAIF